MCSLTWMTVANDECLESTPRVCRQLFHLAATSSITGSGVTTTNYLDAGAATNTPARYYRVRLVP